MAMVTAATAGFGLMVIALFLWLIVRASTRGELPANSMLGIRTQATKRSPAAWHAAHAAAVPGLRAIALVAVAGAIIPVIIAATLGPNTGSGVAATDWAVGLAYSAVIVLLGYVTFIANSAARKVSG